MMRSTSSMGIPPGSDHPSDGEPVICTGWSASCSSAMSPTSSSAMSSTVTMPAKPPYSSITIAISASAPSSVVSTAGSGSVVGTMTAGRR